MTLNAARRAALSCALALAAVATTLPAAADDPPAADSAAEARQQYGLGQKAFSAKRYSEAALHFESAAGYKASAIALYTAALAWDLASRPERAADAYARALDVPGLDEKQTNTAKERVAALEKSMGTVQVVAPDGFKVQIDTFTEVKTPARLHGSAGIHSLNVHPPDKPIEKRELVLEAGKTVPVDLKEDAAKPAPKKDEEPVKKEEPKKDEPPPMRLREPFWTTGKAVGVGLIGVGVAVLGGGVLLGISANDAGDAYNAAPSRAAFDHAESLQGLTNIAFFAGAVALAGGVVLMVLPLNGGGFRAGVSPTGMKLEGTF